MALVLVVAGPLLAVSLVTDTAASLAASRSAVSVVSPVGRPSLAASRSPAAASVGRRSVRWRWSVGPSASLATYVINTSVLVADQHHGNGPPWLVGVSLYPPTRRSAALSRNFLFFNFLFFFENREASLTSLRERLANYEICWGFYGQRVR